MLYTGTRREKGVVTDMLLESIAYTASLVDYISQEIRCSVGEVTERIGPSGIARLCHNAPMNKHLPESRIAHEVECDYLSIIQIGGNSAIWNEVFGLDLMGAVKESCTNHHQYAHRLFELLTAIATDAEQPRRTLS